MDNIKKLIKIKKRIGLCAINKYKIDRKIGTYRSNVLILSFLSIAGTMLLLTILAGLSFDYLLVLGSLVNLLVSVIVMEAIVRSGSYEKRLKLIRSKLDKRDELYKIEYNSLLGKLTKQDIERNVDVLKRVERDLFMDIMASVDDEISNEAVYLRINKSIESFLSENRRHSISEGSIVRLKQNLIKEMEDAKKDKYEKKLSNMENANKNIIINE